LAGLPVAGVFSPAPRRDRKASLPKPASYARYSSELQDEVSIDQQLRKCREAAQQNNHNILLEFEFSDDATSGQLLNRAGFDALLREIRAGNVNVVYFENLSRMARSFVNSVNILKEIVDVYGVRVISVSESIDTANGNWELPTFIRALMHEEFIKNLRAAVLRGQEDAVLRDISVGDTCFGYVSQPIPQSESSRRGRHPKPRMQYVVNEEEAEWVRQIFDWFVNHRWTISKIRKELTRSNAPKDRRSCGKSWGRTHVRGVLRNAKYIGIWVWGRRENVRNPFTGKVRQAFRPLAELAKWTRLRPDLRIVNDDLFYKAQATLDEYELQCRVFRDENGRLHGSSRGRVDGAHLLQGLMQCGQCGALYTVAGRRYLVCKGYQSGQCTCKTRLDRRLAEATILRLLREHILNDGAWLDLIVDAAIEACKKGDASKPEMESQFQRQIAELRKKLDRLVDQIEDGQADDAIHERMRQRRIEMSELERQLAKLRAVPKSLQSPPTREWVVQQLQQLSDLFETEVSSANQLLRNWLGAIALSEVQRPFSKRKGLVGHCKITTTQVIASMGIECTDDNCPAADSMMLDFRPEFEWASCLSEVKSLFDQGMTDQQIADEFKWPASRVVKALERIFADLPEGLAEVRRSRKPQRREPRVHEKIANEVKQLWDRRLTVREIASNLEVCRKTVSLALRHWHVSRNLIAPDGRVRCGRKKRAAVA